jgi:hypothetical protein
MRAAKTHFEQIPVDTVLKVAKRLPENNVDGNDSVNVETQDEVSSPNEEGWREVAQQVQQEQDPKRLSGLVQKLLIELDEEKLRKNGTIGRSGPSC